MYLKDSQRMGWTRRKRLGTSEVEIVVSLSEGMMGIARDGVWKIHLFGLGKFVVLKNTDQQVTVTFYPEHLEEMFTGPHHERL